AGAHPDVSRGNVRVVAEVTIRLRHPALTEPHDFRVTESVRVEVAATLGTAEALVGEGVLEGLLEPEELHDAEVHRRVEAKAALEGTERGVELHPEAAVDPHDTVVVLPRHTEDHLAFGFDEALQDRSEEHTS